MNPRFIPFITVLGVVSLSGAFGVRPAPSPAPDATPAPAEKPAPYVLKHKSSYGLANDEQQRAPFWPIGWSKRKAQDTRIAAVQVAEAPKAATIDEKSIKLTSILLGNPSLAIINGRTYSEGEFLRVAKGAGGSPAGAGASISTSASRVRVYRINDGNVMLQNQDQIITVALQRPELSQRNAESLLIEDRP